MASGSASVKPADQHASSPPPPAQPVTSPTNQAQTSPPAKRDLVSWWKQFKKNTKKEEEKIVPTGIFGVPLQESIKYANVAISLLDENGKSFTYGYVPIVVAKCGVFLKEKATDVEGIFRLSGSAKRIKDLQTLFDSPDRYGKGLDWNGYTVHDAAAILRRYLNQLPEPIIPLEFYDQFREPLRGHQAQAVGDTEAQAQAVEFFDQERAIRIYQELITKLPPLNRQLLLYILDLLAVFASKSDLNRMTAANLAAIFQPGILSHPTHDMAPQEYRLSQDVLIFLIENQDHFLIGMTGTAADEKTRQEMSGGAPSPATPYQGRNKNALARSASNGSAGADSVRKYGSIRRNLSVSSKQSKHSSTAHSPVTPSYGTPYASSNTGSGVHRSNTVPSKKSPILSNSRFNKPSEPSTPTSAGLTPPAQAFPVVAGPASPLITDSTTTTRSPLFSAASPDPNAPVVVGRSTEMLLETPGSQQPSSITPTRERHITGLFSKSPTSDTERKEARQPNKLRKKQRVPSSAQQSANSSANSLDAGDIPQPPSQALRAGATPGSEIPPPASLVFYSAHATPMTEDPPSKNVMGNDSQASKESQAHLDDSNHHSIAASTLKPSMSPTPSFHSHSSVTDHSDFDRGDHGAVKPEREKRRSRWRTSFHKMDKSQLSANQSGSAIGSNSGAGFSSSSVGSGGHAVKSTTNDSQQTGSEPSGILTPSGQHLASEGEQSSGAKDSEKKGPIDWLRNKMRGREGNEDRKERAKSPPPVSHAAENTTSSPSLAAVVEEAMPVREEPEEIKESESKEEQVVQTVSDAANQQSAPDAHERGTS